MRTIEIEAKSLEEATILAGEKLGCEPDKLDVILLEEKSGILGLRRRVKIQATAPEDVESEDSTPKTDLDEQSDPPDWAMDPSFDARNALETICRRVLSESSVQTDSRDGRMLLEIQGDGSGIFIGRKGKTLEALQFIINKMNLKQTGRSRHIIVDSEGYVNRRIEILSNKARELAERAATYRKPQMSEPLNAHDRRIIHTTLRDEQDVVTRSIGNSEFKRVQVSIKRQM